MSDIIYEARDIRKTYTLGNQIIKILQGVEVSVKSGEMLGIVGASGAGKSTLLHILGLLDRPDSGKLSFRNEEINYRDRGKNAKIRNRCIGFVFQFYHLLPELTAVENVSLTRMMDCGVASWFSQRKRIRDKALSLLSSLGLGERLRHKPTQLSGGERQRVAIARALMSDPDLLFCDEPTGNLDERTSDTIIELLFQLNREQNQTMVVVTHNESFAEKMPRLLRLSEGKLQNMT